MERIPDEVYEQFLWLLVKYDCPYALLFIANEAQAAGLSAKDFLRNMVEKELSKAKDGRGETKQRDSA